MSSMQITGALSEREAGLLKGLFAAASEADNGQFSDTLKKTLAKFNQALEKGQPLSAEWLQRLQQQATEKPSLQKLLDKLGLGQNNSDLSGSVTSDQLDINLGVKQTETITEGGGSLPFSSLQAETSDDMVDAPENLLAILSWAEQALTQRESQLSAAANNNQSDDMPVASQDGTVIDPALIISTLQQLNATTKQKIAADNSVTSEQEGATLTEASQDDFFVTTDSAEAMVMQDKQADKSVKTTLDPENINKRFGSNADLPEVESSRLVNGEEESVNGALNASHLNQSRQSDAATALAEDDLAGSDQSLLQQQTSTQRRNGQNLTAAEQPKGMPEPGQATLAIEAAALAAAERSAETQQPSASSLQFAYSPAVSSEMNGRVKVLDEAKQALFNALNGEALQAEGDEQSLSLSPLAKAVAERFTSSLADVSLRTQDQDIAQRELTVTTQTSSQTHQSVSQSITQQARPELQTLLQQAVDIRHQEVAADQLRQRLLLMVAGKLNRAEIRLDPPELGSLMVRVQVQNDQAQVHIVTQNTHAKEMLEQSLPRLREMLQQQGVTLGDTQVSQQGSSQQQFNNGESDPASAWQQLDDMDEIEMDIPVIQPVIAQGRIDYFA